MSNEKIKVRIQKLLDLAGRNPNKNEAQSALLKAQKLMAKYNLEKNDINSSSKEIQIVEVESETTVKGAWKRALAQLIAENFKCMGFINNYGRGRYKYVFFGEKEDADVAKAIFEYAHKWLNKKSSNYATQMREKEGITKGVKHDYIIGFLKGLKERFDEQKNENNELALVVVPSEEVKNEYKSLNLRRSNTGNQINPHGSKKAHNAGFEEGKKFSTNQLKE